MNVMERAAVDGLELEYELRGSGEPVVLIHWGVSAIWAEPLLDEPSLRDRYRLLSYHRAGFGGSGSSRVGDDGRPRQALPAPHARARDRARARRRSLVERRGRTPVGPRCTGRRAHRRLDGRRATVSADRAAGRLPPRVRGARSRALPRGDKEGAVDTFFRGVFGPDYRDPLQQGLPGAFEQAVSDADTFFTQELPALWERWSFTEEDASASRSPCSLSSARTALPRFPSDASSSAPGFPRSSCSSFPAPRTCFTWKPSGDGGGLASFFARHPIPASI